jgi:tetratricopeptide (TPR) repeat protein
MGWPTPEPAFVGRERELTALESGLIDALAGRGSIFLVSGEPGIGKSALAAEVAIRADIHGTRVLWGRCWEAGGAPAYWPWVQSIRSYLRDEDPTTVASQLGNGAAEIAQLIPAVREILPALEPVTPADTDGARFRLFDSVASFLREAADARPIVLVLDDLHAADVPSLLLLRFLADEIADSRIVILGAYREEDVEADHTRASVLNEIGRQPGIHRLRLTGLDADEATALIGSTAGIVPPHDLAHEIVRETEGNPLFVREVVRLIAAGGGFGGHGSIRISIPAQVREVIDDRLRRLPDGSREILLLASVIGRTFGLDVLSATSGRSPDELLADLDEAIAAHVVADVPGSLEMTFSHALVRDVLYEGLPLRRRIQLHGAVGHALEAVYAPDLDPHLAELAHHFTLAATVHGDVNAVRYPTRAADRAARLLAHEEAVRLYGSALESLGSTDEPTRLGLLLALGDAQMRAGDGADARETFLEAAEIARRRGLPEELAHAALGYGGRFVWARSFDDPHLVPLLQEALRELPDVDGPARVRLMARLAGGPLRDTEPVEHRRRMGQEAVDMARRLGDSDTLAYALDGQHCADMGPGSVERRTAIAEELLEISRATGDKERAFVGHDYSHHSLLESGDIVGAKEAYAALVREAERLRQPAQRWFAAVNGIKLALFEGRFAGLNELIREATALGRSTRSRNVGMAADLQTYALRREQGRLAEVADVVERGVAEYPAYPVWRYVRMDLLTQLDRHHEAQVAFDDLASRGFPLYLEMQWLFSMSLAAETCGRLRDTERSADLYRLLLPFASHNSTLPPELCRGSVSRELGILAATRGDWDVAVGHLEDALEMNERMGTRPWVAHTQYDFARMLLDRDLPGDRLRAGELLAAASALCRELDMVALEGRIAELLGAVAEDEVPATRVAGNDRPRLDADRLTEDGSQPGEVFRREGEFWSIRFGADEFRLADSKGIRYIAMLLAGPGRELLALDIATSASGVAPRTSRTEDGLGPASRPSRGGEILDARARAEYRRRLEELEDEAEEAERSSDPARTARAREESDFLARELASAIGLGGRDRHAPSDTERARVNVTKAIRSALARIRRFSPRLADHLDRSIRTGTFCSYDPDPRASIDWRL